MSSNLANVYANLLRKYGESFVITYVSSPSYLNNILGVTENPGKIILFYLEDRSTGKSLKFKSPSKLNIKETHENLDLTGSPLKDECEVDALDDMLNLDIICSNPWKPEEEYHKGILVEKARAIITSEDFQNGPSAVDAFGSVWFLCSGADLSKTQLLQYEFLRKQCSRGIVTYRGLIASDTVTCQSLLQDHSYLVGKGSRIETNIENIYNIKSNISIKCSWSTSSTTPALIDLRTCDVSLNQTFRFGENGTSTLNFTNQLRTLIQIRDEIISYKQSENLDMAKEPIYSCGIGIDMAYLRETINQVMTEIAEVDTTSGAKRDIEDVIQNAQIRQLNDLTDKLWEILKQCSSYKDLKMAYNILFQCAARSNIVNTPTNKNRLAEIITEVANRRLAIPCLAGSEPLELLLEIGLEKLYKDYEYIFVESNVCSANDLKRKSIVHENKENDAVLPNVRKSLRNAIMQDTAAMRKTLLHNDVKSCANKMENDMICFKNSNFNELESAKKLEKLFQIHCILEHLLMIRINLNVTSVYYEVCEQLLRRSPKTIDLINDSLTDEIDIKLSADYVRELLGGKDPHSRRITMKSKNKLREVTSTFYFNMENICPPNLSECFNTEEKEFSKNNVYHNWLYRKISTVKSQ